MIRWLAAACRAKQAVIALTVAGVVLLTACGPHSAGPGAAAGTPGTASSMAITSSLSVAPTPAATTPPVEESPSMAPAPFPEASPVTVAGWQAAIAPTWGGYTFPVNGVTGVRAQWTQPSATGGAGAQASVWIGIGGWHEQDLIQAGTSASPPGPGFEEVDDIWYELLPAGPQSPPVTVIPGDKIAVSILQLRPPQEKWQISIDDMSADQTFTQVVQYASADSYPDFIVEDPSETLSPSSPPMPFPHWSSVSFSNMQIRIGNQWKPAASFYGYRIQMVRNGRTLVTTGPLDRASGFTAHQER